MRIFSLSDTFSLREKRLVFAEGGNTPAEVPDAAAQKAEALVGKLDSVQGLSPEAQAELQQAKFIAIAAKDGTQALKQLHDDIGRIATNMMKEGKISPADIQQKFAGLPIVLRYYAEGGVMTASAKEGAANPEKKEEATKAEIAKDLREIFPDWNPQAVETAATFLHQNRSDYSSAFLKTLKESGAENVKVFTAITQKIMQRVPQSLRDEFSRNPAVVLTQDKKEIMGNAARAALLKGDISWGDVTILQNFGLKLTRNIQEIAAKRNGVPLPAGSPEGQQKISGNPEEPQIDLATGQRETKLQYLIRQMRNAGAEMTTGPKPGEDPQKFTDRKIEAGVKLMMRVFEIISALFGDFESLMKPMEDPKALKKPGEGKDAAQVMDKTKLLKQAKEKGGIVEWKKAKQDKVKKNKTELESERSKEKQLAAEKAGADIEVTNAKKGVEEAKDKGEEVQKAAKQVLDAAEKRAKTKGEDLMEVQKRLETLEAETKKLTEEIKSLDELKAENEKSRDTVDKKVKGAADSLDIKESADKKIIEILRAMKVEVVKDEVVLQMTPENSKILRSAIAKAQNLDTVGSEQLGFDASSGLLENQEKFLSCLQKLVYPEKPGASTPEQKKK